jgi:Tfp pilus assembly protein PilX
MYQKIAYPQKSTDEAGFASLVISIVLVIVLSLTTVGFADLVRHERTEALNRQLSQAAYYAAESGVNDGAKALRQGYATPKKTCAPLPATTTGPGAYLTNNIVTSNGDLASSYPCLLIYPAPSDIQFTSVGSTDADAKSFVVSAVDATDGTTPTALGSFTISWQEATGKSIFAPLGWAGSHPFADASAWVNGGQQVTGLLEVQIVPLNDGVDRTSLINNAYTAYLYPNSSSSAPVNVNYSDGTGSNAGVIVNGNCNTGQARFCKAVVNIPGHGSQFLVRLISRYTNSSVGIVLTGVGSAPLRAAGVQSLIDSTGKAGGVLRRLQVRVPNQGTSLPQYGVEALDGICKQLSVQPNAPAVSGCDNVAN